MNDLRYALGMLVKQPGLIRLFILFASLAPSFAAEIKWHRVSSAKGQLPVPGESTQQTGNLIADFDQDGIKDFVISFRQKAPALVWYRRSPAGWERYVVEPQLLTVEAGWRWRPRHRFRRRLAEHRGLVVGKSVSELRCERRLETARDQAGRPDAASRPGLR